jgi:putative ABC transport system permease protein
VIGEPGRYDAISVRAADGVSQTEVVGDLRAALGATTGVEAITGDQAVDEAKAASATGVAFMNTFLMAFAITALLVGSFVISNTFSITVAQRSKETAMLRAIGASRRQVKRAIWIEALLTGITASALGVVLGVGAAMGLRALLAGFGLDLHHHLSLAVDAALFRDRDPAGASSRATASTSLAWMAGRNLQLDVGVVAGLNGATPDREAYFGFARRF